MKRILLFALLSGFLYLSSFSQTDTVYKYYSKTGSETTKDSALSHVKFYKKDNMWHGNEYYSKSGKIKSEGSYLQPNTETPDGSFNNYKEDGKLDYTTEYVEGKLNEKMFYYKSGEKKSWISYSNSVQTNQKGWDEAGKEIKNYIVEKEATFKGGAEGYRKYLEKNLDADLAANVGAPAGSYQVQVQFIINKDGLPANVKVISAPAKCKPCGAEAARVIREGPAWEPAIQNNEPVIYQAIQYVTFQVVEDKKKG